MGGDNTTNQKHGLAGTIRSATESETFDLGGMGLSTIETAVREAFGDPFFLEDGGGENGSGMIRITLVVGAGKAGRQKYDPSAPRTVTAALREAGFEEDRGASCVASCAGLFKLQHDTGKNLKTVVVFPKLPAETKKGGESRASSDAPSSSSSSSLLPEGSMIERVAVSSLPVFENMVKFGTPTWSEKRALLRLLDEKILSLVADCDAVLIRGTPLSPPQQDFYDSCRALDEKRAHCQQKLHEHVELGRLTVGELAYLKEQVDHKIDEAKAGSKPVPKKLAERQQKLRNIEVSPGDNVPQLKHHAALGKLWKECAPLEHLDENSGKLLSVKETRLLGKKMELMEEIDRLEQASQGWLEEDDAFAARVKASRKEHHDRFGIHQKGSSARSNKGGGGGGKGSSSTLSANTRVKLGTNTKWVTPGGGSGGAGWSKNQYGRPVKKKKGKTNKGDLFGAMMAASSSDEEEDDDDDHDDHEEEEDLEDEVTHDETPEAAPTAQNPSPAKTGKNKNKKNKKANKKGGNKKANNKDDEAALREATAERRAEQAALAKRKKKEQEHSGEQHVVLRILVGLLALLQDYLVPAFLALIAWLVTVFYGKPKQSKKKNKNKNH